MMDSMGAQYFETWRKRQNARTVGGKKRVVFVLVLLAHDRRRIRHVAVTAHPTAAWTAQQVPDAFPWDEAPGM
jgi:hypothetical protein